MCLYVLTWYYIKRHYINKACAMLQKALSRENMLSKNGRQHNDSMFVFRDNITTVSHLNKKGKPPIIGLSFLHHDDKVEDGNQKSQK